MSTSSRVLIIAENASFSFGGEASLPLHYFLGLRDRGVFVKMITHGRNRAELDSLLTNGSDDIHYVEDSSFQRIMWQLGRKLPDRLSYHTFGFLSRLVTQIQARQIGKRIIAENSIKVVHQPMPVSPREPSLIHGLGVPVVMGPMNGNMSFPPFFQRQGKLAFLSGLFVRGGRALSLLIDACLPGKRSAEVLLVANDRTKAGLPPKATGLVLKLVENAIDPQIWCQKARLHRTNTKLRIAFVGRLVDWKKVDLILKTLANPRCQEMELSIVGEGFERDTLQRLAAELDLTNRVTFHGWQSQINCAEILSACDCLLLPSIFECGGAVVLEAMAAGLPVIATDWGGPADYLTDQCGFLITPESEQSMVDQIVTALVTLQENPALGRKMGMAGKERVLSQFTWPAKIDEILEIYRLAQRRFHKS